MAQRKREKRRQLFSARLQKFMERAEVGDNELGKRIDVSRLTVRRWREAESLPDEEMIYKLKQGLSWVDSGGVIHELTDAEVRQLLVAAGYLHLPVSPEPDVEDRVTWTDRCVVYTHRYSHEGFPSKWSSRIMELERLVPGSIYVMNTTLPSITRISEYYEGAYKSGMYGREKVEAYMVAHETRQQEFLQRLQSAEVRHLYSIKGIENYLSNAWTSWKQPNKLLRAQLTKLLAWLETYENFEVRLRETNVPGDVNIIGYDVVLVEFSPEWATLPNEAIHGLEIVGASAAVQFTKQFSSFWTDRATIKDRRRVIRELQRLRDTLSE
jgi:hypothetical protein